jgi:hypothetical protein
MPRHITFVMITPMEDRDPLKRMADRLRELRDEDSVLAERRAVIATEIERLESAAATLRQFAPVGRLPYVDADAPVAQGDLSNMTLPKAALAIMRSLEHGATTRELLELLIKAGKLDPSKGNTNHINLLNTLKRHTEWFKKDGSIWTFIGDRSLAASNGNLPYDDSTTKEIEE